MPTIPFEYEERYKVTDIELTQRQLAVAGFAVVGEESQMDHWFIPKSIMSPEEQYQWFDYEKGYALRIREESTAKGTRNVITAKQLLSPGDHSAMTNHESVLTIAGVRQVLASIGDEFADLLASLRQRSDDEVLPFLAVKHLIEQSGRKEYITLDKKRTTFRNPGVQDIVIDLDVIPALKETSLGYSAAIEIEYTGDASADQARETVRKFSQDLGYNKDDILTKALPGQAIAFLATF